MNVNVETREGLCIAAPQGRIDAVSADELQQALDVQLNAGAKRMVLDLKGVEYVSSAGLRIFLRSAKKLPGKLAVCGLNTSVRQIFELAGFDTVLKVCDTRDEAVAQVS